MNKFLFFTTFIFILNNSFSQDISQYFEGSNNNLTITIDPDSNNIWQIGKPQKSLFDSAATLPNAIITDTINSYPINNNSIFSFTYSLGEGSRFVDAIQWMQKLDMESGKDGGIVEFSRDSGATWQNMLTSPFVYKQYGYDSTNVDTLSNGEIGFTGTDSTWKNIWLCFDGNYYQGNIKIRFTFISDSINTNQEGWIIDNFYAYEGWVHTLEEARKKQEKLIEVYPTVTTRKINIVIKKLIEKHYVEDMKLVDINGRVIYEYGKIPSRFFIELNVLNSGQYFLQVKTNLATEVFPITLIK